MKRILIMSFVITIIITVLCSCNLHRITNTIKVDSKPSITEKPKTTVNPSITEKPQFTGNLAVVYYGIALNDIDRNIDILSLTDIQQKQNILKKYEKEYYLYANRKLIGKATGKVEGSGLDSWWNVVFTPKLDNYKVAISESYNPYPINIVYTTSNFQQEFASSSNIIIKINNKFSVSCDIKELATVDLDGDEKNEYLALFADERNNFFAKCLLDSQYNIISYLTVFKENCVDFSGTVDLYNFRNNGEIIDINNDGVMEIIVDMPSYEGLVFRVFTYKNGEFDGDFINKASFQP